MAKINYCSEMENWNELSETEKFVFKARKVHGDLYDYSKTEYVKSNQKVIIICPIHGEFIQRCSDHLSGSICAKCNGNYKLNTTEYILKCSIVHHNIYDYSKTNYTNNSTKVKVICKIHGEFEIRADSHLQGCGCKSCFFDKISISKSEFINRANIVHHNKYDYSKTFIKGVNYKIDIVCPTHGTFSQIAKDHLKGIGCARCKSSKGEIKIREWLISKNILFEEQKKFNECVGKNNVKLPFDFYLPAHNICIEFDGKQHFELIHRSHDIQKNINNFQSIKRNDNIKNNFCVDIKLIRIPYYEKNNIDTILSKVILN